MLKTDNKDAVKINKVISAKCLPGQIRLPYPHVDDNNGSSRTLPSSSKNRSGMYVSGSGYTAGSCKIALKASQLAHSGGNGDDVAHQVFPITNVPDGINQVPPSLIQRVGKRTLGYEESVINVVFCGCMGKGCTWSWCSDRWSHRRQLTRPTKRSDWLVPQKFLAHCLDV